MMIAKFFNPRFAIDWEEWSEITGYEEGKGTWSTSGLLWFKENGFEVKHITLFDYDDFAKNGGDYLVRKFGKEIGTWQIEHSNMPKETKKAKELIEKEIVEKREPHLQDIKDFLDKGYLVRCMVNSRRLNGKEGYFGHAVVISEYSEDYFIIQDPGLPPKPNRKVKFEDFEKAWADPNKTAKEIDAIKKDISK
jgi:hypothetical protein